MQAQVQSQPDPACGVCSNFYRFYWEALCKHAHRAGEIYDCGKLNPPSVEANAYFDGNSMLRGGCLYRLTLYHRGPRYLKVQPQPSGSRQKSIEYFPDVKAAERKIYSAAILK